jgi:hypothetical protein
MHMVLTLSYSICIFYMVRRVNFELVKLVRLVKNLELKKRHFGRQKSCVRGVFA